MRPCNGGFGTRDGASVMLYCHDTYGLGHLRRTVSLARYFHARWPGIAQLIVTGSPLAHQPLLPPGADCMKLPSVVKVGAEEYVSRSLAVPFGDIRDLRADLVLSAARHFEPDVLIVDHAPAGLKGEIVPALRHLKERTGARLVLGLRDVVDEAPHVRHVWMREGIYELLDEVYDLILVYGDREVYDVVAEYGLGSRAAGKTRYVGYLRREPPERPPDETRAELDLETDRLVLVTAGGGGDGYALFRAFLEGVRLLSASLPFDCVLVGGPLMPAAERRELVELAGRVRRVRFLESVADLTGYTAAADVVVSMGGYNSVAEILSFARPAVIVPRVAPRKEQLIRAELLARRGLVRVVRPEELTASRLLAEVTRLLADPPSLGPSLDLDGLPAVAAELEAIVDARPTRELAASYG